MFIFNNLHNNFAAANYNELGWLAAYTLLIIINCTAMINPLMIALCLYFNKSKQRSTYANLAKQLAGLESLLGVVPMLCGALVFCILMLLDPTAGNLNMYYLMLGLAIAAMLGGGMSMFSLYMYKKPFYNLVNSLCLILGLILVAFIARAMLISNFTIQAETPFIDVLKNLFIPNITVEEVINVIATLHTSTVKTDIISPLIYVGIWLGLMMTGGLGLIWLTLRRNIDDFGRDYYIFATNFCATLALTGGLAFSMASVLANWQVVLEVQSQKEQTIWMILICSIAIPFAISLIYAIIARSSNPMRLKSLMWIGLILNIALAAASLDFVLTALNNPDLLMNL